MPDINAPNRTLTIKRYEHQRMVALANIQAREIRILELEEEIIRCKFDMENQHKVIADMDRQIAQQREEMAKETAAAQKPPAA
jgi:hypothetical protein